MSIELKIKAISLADESRTIRRFENKLKAQARAAAAASLRSDNASAERQEELILRRQKAAMGFKSLHEHRVGPVRKEARATNIARGLIKGLEYKAIERSAHTEPDWAAVDRMVIKYK